MSQLVMIVDDEPGILSTLSDVLTDEGYRTITTPSGTEAQVSDTTGADGVRRVVVDIIEKDAVEGGRASRALASAFGLGRRGRQTS